MRRWVRSRLAEWYRGPRRRLAMWRQRDPNVWIIVLAGMALGLCLFLFQLAVLGLLRGLADVAKRFR